WAPYRCLYSRNVDNLFMAGRDISVTHEALGAVRVMRTCGCMGEIIGMAASLCKKHESTPRGIYEQHLSELQEVMRHGTGKTHATADYDNQGEPAAARASTRGTATPVTLEPPPWLAKAGANLARSARISVPGNETNSAGLLNDGKADVANNNQRWMSEAKLPQQIELAWDEPQTINAARIVSGYRGAGGKLSGAITDFKLEYRDGAKWKEIGSSATNNAEVDWHATFGAVKGSNVRVVITGTPQSIARIWEIELYEVKGDGR